MNKSAGLYKGALIIFSLCLVSLPVYLFLFGQKEQNAVTLRTLIQHTPDIQALSPRFFSDYLSLSPQGKSLILNRLDIDKIQKKLSAFPVFKTINAKLTQRGDLQVAYELRKPLFFLLDYSGLGVDIEGHVLPLTPFYSPKTLPGIYLGLKELTWNISYPVEPALTILNFFQKEKQDMFTLSCIDLSQVKHARLAHQEIVITLTFLDKVHYLRVHPDRVEQALRRYIHLFSEPSLSKEVAGSLIFDARIKRFATLKPLINQLRHEKKGTRSP